MVGSTNLTREKAEFIWEKAILGMAFVSAEGKWLRANPALCELLEYNEEELQQMTFEQITHPSDTNSDWVMARKVLSGEIDYYVMSKRYLTKTGQIVWAKLRVDRVEENGVFVHFFSQVIPAEVVDSAMSVSDLYETNKKNRSLEEDETVLSRVIFEFVKNNWRSLCLSALAMIGSGYGVYREYERREEAAAKQAAVVESHTLDLAKTSSDIGNIYKLLEEIKRELQSK